MGITPWHGRREERSTVEASYAVDHELPLPLPLRLKGDLQIVSAAI
jgi:hypothetical protein